MPDLSIAYSKANRRDVPAMAKVFKAAFRGVNEFDDAKGYLGSSLDDPEQQLIVAKDEKGNVAGLMMADLTTADEEAINVDQLAVAKAYRGHSIGTQLLKKAEDIALKNHFSAVTLQVRTDNDNAIRLYKGMGYEQVGKHWWYYQDGTTGLEMKKFLGPRKPDEGFHPIRALKHFLGF